MIIQTPTRSIPRRHPERGYALLIILFFVALMSIALTTATLNIVTNARREKEEDMIWRGKQYVRGVRLYYGKTHRFPTMLEDLYKPKTGLRFMRQAYKDPMNTEDGSWRLIYVGPNGQLIGSLKNRSVNLSGQATGAFGSPAGPGGSAFGQQGTSQGGSSMFGSSNGFGSASSLGGNNNSAFGNSNTSAFGGSSSANNAPQGPGITGSTQPGAPSDPNAPPDTTNSTDPQPLSDSSNIIGGNIIGVGSKINKKSIIWFEKAKNYRQFEFVWDPSVDSLTGQRPNLPSNSPNPFGTPGTNGSPSSPLGTSPGSSNPSGTQPPTQGPSGNPVTDPTYNPPLQAPPNP